MDTSDNEIEVVFDNQVIYVPLFDITSVHFQADVAYAKLDAKLDERTQVLSNWLQQSGQD